MLRSLRKLSQSFSCHSVFIPKNTFLTNDYKCEDAWNSQKLSPILNKVNHSDFYNLVSQNYNSRGVISAIDVDIFANSITDSVYLEELKDLLHKLRLSAETGNTLPSTHHAVIRGYIEYGDIRDLIDILNDPLNFGLFLDDYSANILLNKLLTSQNFELAAKVAWLSMLQEEYNNEITNALCQFACYKCIMMRDESNDKVENKQIETNKKVEEIKIRVKFLRNPYFDDHFDLKDSGLLNGKTLAWISERKTDNLNYNLQIIGWLMYKKYEKLLFLLETLTKVDLFKISNEVVDLIQKECKSVDVESKILEKCKSIACSLNPKDFSIETSMKDAIENAINKTQSNDIALQEQCFKSWAELREEKLYEQTNRLDRAKRLQLIQEKQKQLASEEQKLWFFENEESIDLTIEEKEEPKDKSGQKTAVAKLDENYIPPEIRPKRK